nr:MAG TPA: hypothetical protein [Caudoviricetes sp.]
MISVTAFIIANKKTASVSLRSSVIIFYSFCLYFNIILKL